MKLLILAIPFDHGKSGISVYMREVTKHLTLLGHQLTLVIEDDARQDFSGYDTYVIKHHPPLLSMLYCLFLLPWKLPFKNYDACLLLAANRRAFCRYPILSLAVVHDLSQYHIPTKYDMFRMLYIKQILPFFVRRAHAVCAISPSTKHDLTSKWHIPLSKLSVVFNGVSFSPVPETTRSAPPPKRPYILYISRLEHPGKNHINLMKAFELLPPRLRDTYDLICPGVSWNGAETILDYAHASPCREHFIFPGFISNDDLPTLFSQASLYVFPSYYEGFGLSLLEAMHYGVPCACSNTSSLHDLGLGAASLFDPNDPESIAVAMFKILNSPDLQQEHIAKGHERVAQFSWRKTAEGLVKILQRPQATLLHVNFFTGTMAAALQLIQQEVQRSRQFNQAQKMFFVNAHCLNLTCQDGEYREILNDATAVFADGIGVKIGAAMHGFKVWDNVNGTDMLPHLLNTKHTFYFLGGKPGVAQKAMDNCRKAFPEARILGCHDGYFKNREADVIRAINRLNPDILLVGLGVPIQEKWISLNLPVLKCGLAIGVGGLFDFASGRIRRAPAWLRACKLEWLFRLSQEPIRLFWRYIVGNPLFILRVLFSSLSRA